MRLVPSLTLGVSLLASFAAPAGAATLVGLTADNHLVTFDSETRRAGPPVMVRGAEGRLLGIDVRPADGKLYGVTDTNRIVTLDATTGRAQPVSQLSMPFESGGRATVDFNPMADRLRLMGMSGVNFRINVANGAVTRDGDLKYQQGSSLAETKPRIVAGAYTDSVAGTGKTSLYTVDSLLRQLNLQAPPNDGVQQARGELAAQMPAGVAFDILTDAQGANHAYLLAGSDLHLVSLETGQAGVAMPVANLPAAEVIDVAVMR